MNDIFPLVYFGNIAWWRMAAQHEALTLANLQIYERQTFRNRMQIMGPNTIQTLSVPINKTNKSTTLIEANIAYSEPWPQLHLRSIQAAYGKSPYYLYYMPYIEMVILGNYPTLAALNLAALEAINKVLKLQLQFDLGASKPSDADVAFYTVSLKKYNQVFETKHGFTPNLSILDLIFNLGPDSKSFLRSVQG